jgi:hypothetical protein
MEMCDQVSGICVRANLEILAMYKLIPKLKFEGRLNQPRCVKRNSQFQIYYSISPCFEFG